MQKARIAFENRIRSMSEGTMQIGRIGWLMESSVIQGVEQTENTFEDIIPKPQGRPSKRFFGMDCYEKELEKQMTPIVENSKIYVEWLGRIKGIGILTSAKLIAYFEPYWAEIEIQLYRKKKERTGEELDKPEVKTIRLHRPYFRSSLVNLCGYGVDNESHRAFCRANYDKNTTIMGNAEYKTTMFKLFTSILYQKGKCYDLWKKYDDEVKASYSQYLMKNYGFPTRAEVRKAFPNKYIPSTMDLSRRRFIKTFLSIFWEKMQETYGLSVSTPQHCRDVPMEESEWIHPKQLCD